MKQDFGKAKTTFESQNENAASVVKLCKVTAGSPRERRLQPPARGFGRTAWPAGRECIRKDRPKHTHTYTTPTGRMDGSDPTAGTRGTDEIGRGLPNATRAATWWRVLTGPESPGSRTSEPGDDVLVGVPHGQTGAGRAGPDVELDGLIRPPDIDRHRGRVAAHRHDPDTAVGLEPRVDARHRGRTHPGDRDVAEMQAHAVLGREAVDLDGLPVKGAPEKQYGMKAGQGRRAGQARP